MFGPYEEFKEVQNVYTVYNKIEENEMANEFQFLEAHKILIQGLVLQSGRYRSIHVGSNR